MPHCTLRLSHLSVGGNTRGLEMVRLTRHVGAGLRGLLGPTAHGLLGLLPYLHFRPVNCKNKGFHVAKT